MVSSYSWFGASPFLCSVGHLPPAKMEMNQVVPTNQIQPQNSLNWVFSTQWIALDYNSDFEKAQYRTEYDKDIAGSNSKCCFTFVP